MCIRDRSHQGEAATKAKKDYDGDGKVESSSKEHAGAVHNAIQRKKGGKPDGQDTRKESVGEEVIYEKDCGSCGDKITGKKVNNKKYINLKPTVESANPEDQKAIELKKKMLQKKMMLQRQAMQMQKQGKLPLNYSEGCDSSKPEEKNNDEDPRSMKTKINLGRNKLRAMGIKMSYDCLLYTSPSPRDLSTSRMPSSA